MTNNYEIDKVFIASTSHITGNDNYLLDEKDYYFVDLVAYGCIIWTGIDKKELSRLELSKALIDLIQLAKNNDCSYLKLDSDGPTYNNLPIFDW